MHLTHVLANHVADRVFRTAPAPVREKARCCLLDAVTAAVASQTVTGTTAIRSVATKLYGSGTAPVWFAGCFLTSAGAAFSNSATVSALDFDDGHRVARGHPGAAVIPAVLAAAAECPVDPDGLWEAIIAGYEIAVRIAAAQNPANIKSRQSGLWAGYGAVAGAGSVFRTRPDRLAHAFAINGVWAPNQMANGSSGYSKLTGNNAKEGIPWSVATGLTALELAVTGFTGPEDILDHSSHFDGDRILAGLGSRWEILDTYFKPYACCRYIHPAIDAVVDLMQAHRLGPSDVVTVDVQTFQWAERLQNKIIPDNLVEAQYSLPFCVAAAICHGPSALAPIDTGLLLNRGIHALASRISLTVDPELDRRFPAETLARITLTTRLGDLGSDVVTPRGDVGRPFIWQHLVKKFRQVSSARMTEQRQAAFLEAIAELDRNSPALLLNELARSLRD